MPLRVAPLALLLACAGRDIYDQEIRIVRSGLHALEKEAADSSAFWLPEFDNVLEDYTSGIPAAVYRHILWKVSRLTDAEVSRVSDVSQDVIRSLMQTPSKFRGRFVRAYGRILKVWVEDLDSSVYPAARAIGGLLLVGGVQPVLFHALERSDVLEARRDLVHIDGVFLKIVEYELRGGGTMRAPFLVGRMIYRYS